ncbi:MAG: thiamine pyrophosphate-dependent dehydrogenase E1 component subunit alpha [Streptococcaceae bacterium]|nr:thiamine pyrophosphate-dependent dehydrogenase E1 component subunit alpha [Streptococcaceae bacterium]
MKQKQKKALLTHRMMEEAYFKMWQIRSFEEALIDLSEKGELYGTFHLSIGQEATAVGVCSQLKETDLITSTHRNHGHSLAKGTSPYKMFAEILSRQTGTSKGKGGSMHISDQTVGNLGSNGIVAGGLPIGAGAALSAKMRNSGQVVVSFLGDGAVNEGAFHETMNLAAIWNLPIIFFIENNQYAMSSSVEEMNQNIRLHERANGYGIRGIQVDGNDLEEVMQVVQESVASVRKFEGPLLIEAITYRHHGHSKSDSIEYRTEEEEAAWITENDPISRFVEVMKQAGISAARIQELQNQARQSIQTDKERALLDPFSELSESWKDVYAGEIAEKFKEAYFHA